MPPLLESLRIRLLETQVVSVLRTSLAFLLNERTVELHSTKKLLDNKDRYFYPVVVSKDTPRRVSSFLTFCFTFGFEAPLSK